MPKTGKPHKKPFLQRSDIDRVMGTLFQLTSDAYEVNMYADALSKSLTFADLKAVEGQLVEAASLIACVKRLTKEMVHSNASPQNVNNLTRT